MVKRKYVSHHKMEDNDKEKEVTIPIINSEIDMKNDRAKLFQDNKLEKSSDTENMIHSKSKTCKTYLVQISIFIFLAYIFSLVSLSEKEENLVSWGGWKLSQT